MEKTPEELSRNHPAEKKPIRFDEWIKVFVKYPIF